MDLTLPSDTKLSSPVGFGWEKPKLLRACLNRSWATTQVPALRILRLCRVTPAAVAAQVAAVAQGRLLIVPDKGLERPSGQMVEAVARLCQVIAPNR